MERIKNSSLEDVLKNKQNQYQRISYFLDEINACSDIGKIRSKQEDAVLLLPHFYNPEFKLLAVADGMGGLSFGCRASNLALLELIKWFQQLSKLDYYKELKISQELEIKLHEIDHLIRKICKEGGTTLSLAIVCKYNTIFINIGDSRIYIQKDNNVEQISTDHSVSYELFLKGQIKNKDDIRFHRKNNLLLSRLGGLKKLLKIEKIILTNSDYQKALFFTDGITDCLSDEQLIRSVKKFHNQANASELLVDMALTTISENKTLDINEYYDIINAGKDNATAIVFCKK